MSVFDFLRRKREVAVPPPPPFELDLKPAPIVNPLPVTAGDPLDAAVNRLWQQFRRDNPNAAWPAFVADLRAFNTNLDAQIAKKRLYLTDYPPGSDLKR